MKKLKSIFNFIKCTIIFYVLFTSLIVGLGSLLLFPILWIFNGFLFAIQFSLVGLILFIISIFLISNLPTVKRNI